jgi:phage shock protein PspC (stress-responsive transcriptional regulator)
VTTGPGSASAHILRRDRDAGWVGGVAAGIARRFGIDVSLVRLAFVVATAAGGFGLGAYLLGWILIPAGESGSARSRLPTGRAAVEVALGTGLLLLAALLAFRELGIWFSDAIVWPLVLIASGGALLWRQSLGGPEPGVDERPSSAPAEAAPHAALAGATSPASPSGEASRAALAAESRRAAAAISRTGIGIALVIAAGFVFLQATGALGAARDVLLALIAAVVVLGVIFAPWVVRLVRSLTQERAQRIRSQERAEMATQARSRPSRAARSASFAPGWQGGRRRGRPRGSRPRSRRPPRTWRSATACRWRWSWWATASSTAITRRSWLLPARR